jgi:hypothetical protein
VKGQLIVKNDTVLDRKSNWGNGMMWGIQTRKKDCPARHRFFGSIPANSLVVPGENE